LTIDVRHGRADETPPVLLWVIAAVAVIPFPASALMYGYGPAEHMKGSLTMLLTWSAIILAFIGGVRWGLETREPRPRRYRLAFSALCAAAAWAVLLARGQVPDAWLLGLFIAVFLIQWLFAHQTPEAPSRYPMLSHVMVGAACVSLALALEKAISG
jgi:hypothetical protein